MDISKTKNLPDTPGVYFFYGKDKQILYIGRATSLRNRVKSYFKDDVIRTRGPLIVDMVSQAVLVDYLQTDSVLEAVIAEANLIKKWAPPANVREKDDKSFNYVAITKEEYPQVLLVRGKDIDESKKEKFLYIFGPYPQGGVLKEGMRIIRKIFPWRDSKCTPCFFLRDSASGLRKSAGCKPCFNRQIGLCPGVCTGEISKKEYMKTVRNLKLFFEGKKSAVLRTFKKEMNALAKKQSFEEADEVKKKIFSLTHIQDISLIKAELQTENIKEEFSLTTSARGGSAYGGKDYKLSTSFRIEAYDVAHLGGKNVGGVMVVLEDRNIKKSDYRLFKIRTAKASDDVGALREVLERRLKHTEWSYPNVIVVDGGISQKNMAEKVLREANFDITIVSVQKNERHQPERILGDEKIIKIYKKEILLLNSEAHRFAIKYHRKMREKNFL